MSFHSPYYTPTTQCDYAHAREQPAVANSTDKWVRCDGTDAREDVTDKIIDCDAGRGLARHKFCEHGGRHGEDEHGANAKEEVGYQLEYQVSQTAWAIC